MAKLPSISLQDVVITLEAHKRQVGRQYNSAMRKGDYSSAIDLMRNYNNVENQIRFMCAECGCARTTKPYKLGLNAPMNLGLAVDVN
jgi:hypothetical protein